MGIDWAQRYRTLVQLAVGIVTDTVPPIVSEAPISRPLLVTEAGVMVGVMAARANVSDPTPDVPMLASDRRKRIWKFSSAPETKIHQRLTLSVVIFKGHSGLVIKITIVCL